MLDLIGDWALALIICGMVFFANKDDPPPEVLAMNYATASFFVVLAILLTWAHFKPI